MANKTLFKTRTRTLPPAADTRNHAGAPAYAFSDRHALAQYALTGCLSRTFYADAEAQLSKVLELCAGIDPIFIAQTALYARREGYMKDMPALLCAVLAAREPRLCERVAPRVLDNGKMLRNFVQILRSGAVGRKSLGTVPKRIVRTWLEQADDNAIFRAAVGNSPSLADIVKMVHPKPATPRRAALYGYLLGKPHDAKALPDIVQHYEAFKTDRQATIPDVPFQYLTSLDLTDDDWKRIAMQAPWQMTRMNLNTFARHGVFKDARMVTIIAGRLRQAAAIKRARVFPYQLLAAWQATVGPDARAEKVNVITKLTRNTLNIKENTDTPDAVPREITDALRDAMEHAIQNVPTIAGRIVVCPDVSGSMQSPVTGLRHGAVSTVRCIDVAALVTAALLRRNPDARVLPFEQTVSPINLKPNSRVMTNAQALAAIGGGGTNCSAPLALLNKEKAYVDLVVLVSDNESWVDATRHGATATMQQWEILKTRNPKAQLICIDIQPYGSTQAQERKDILNIGGFSDQIFTVIADFVSGTLNPNRWVQVIENVEI